jgi:3-dehydroquinate synthetase
MGAAIAPAIGAGASIVGGLMQGSSQKRAMQMQQQQQMQDRLLQIQAEKRRQYEWDTERNDRLDQYKASQAMAGAGNARRMALLRALGGGSIGSMMG